MNPLPLDEETLLRRLNGIEGELVELAKLREIPFKAFASGIGFKLAQYHLHRALEGVFHIGGHLLSRIPGASASGYKEIAAKLGEYRVVEQAFASGPLRNMAGYRIRLVHFYAEIMPEEIVQILHHHLTDIESFLKAVRAVLDNPEKWGIPRSK